MNAQQYLEFLKRAVRERSASWRRKTILVDGASFHHTAEIKAWVAEHGLEYKKNSPRSPKFNAIEEAWAWIKGYINRKRPTNKAEQEKYAREAFAKYPASVRQSHILHAQQQLRSFAVARKLTF